MDELRAKAAAFLRRPCIMSEPGGRINSLVRRYAGGERLNDADSQQQLSLCLAAAQTEVAARQGATTYPELDALAFYERATAILHDIQAENTTDQ